jgi:hypothetical protein
MFWFRKKSKTAPAPSHSFDATTPGPKANDAPVVNESSLESAATADPASRKRRRPASSNKTRLMGFDTSDGRVVDLFDESKSTEVTQRIQFPVAIVMVVQGPGKGEAFALQSGMSQIGRGDDQAIQLDFGDMAVSRTNHAAIVYDPKDHSFLLGHGGKSNIVRLNGQPVVATSALSNGDEIEIGETVMRFVAICSDDFHWAEEEVQEEGTDDDDVEIA